MKDEIIKLLTVILKPIAIAIAIYIAIALVSDIGIKFMKETKTVTIATNYTTFTNVVIRVYTNHSPGWIYDTNQKNNIGPITLPIVPIDNKWYNEE